jgi:hypothetical protein
MTNIAGYCFRLAVIGAAACGCGSSNSTTGGAASCGSTAACGGTVDGTWQLDSVCTEGDLPAALESTLNFPTECAGAVHSATMSATGTAAFANGMQTDNVTTTIQGTAVVSAACVAAELGSTITLSDTVCALVQAQISGTTGITSATCSFASGNCNCSVTYTSSNPTPKAYTVSGTSITYTNGDAPTDYCVAGSTLTARQLRVDFGNIYVDSTLHKI